MFKRPTLRKTGVDPDKVNFKEPEFSERLRIHKRFIVPIADLKGYLWLMKRHGATDEEIELARRRNTPGDPLNCVTTTYKERVYHNQPKKLKAVKKFKKQIYLP
jgi:hypothetical protein